MRRHTGRTHHIVRRTIRDEANSLTRTQVVTWRIADALLLTIRQYDRYDDGRRRRGEPQEVGLGFARLLSDALAC